MSWRTRWGGGVLLAAIGLSVVYLLMRAPPPATSSAVPRAAAAPVSVTTTTAVRRDFPVLLQTTGTVTALSRVEVRPQVARVIRAVHIREGQFVKPGQLLFTLDSRADEANLAQARARLQQDLAGLADAQRQLERSRELLAQQFISQSAVDTNLARVEAQQATVAADRAAIEAAQVALSHGRIVAAGAGRAGTIGVFPGSMVQPGTDSLVTITQLDPIAVGFNLPQRNLADALRGLRGGQAPVFAELPDGGPVLEGRLQFVDSAVDAGSGAVLAKAVFENPDERLWPGAYVGVRLTLETLRDAIVIPQAALIRGQREQSVYVVDDDQRAALRRVEVRHTDGSDAVVGGLSAGARIVLDGKQNLRPGARVAEAGSAEAAADVRDRQRAAAAPAMTP